VKMSQLLTRTFVLFVSIVALSAAAQAQATRTWVSGVGDDVNPCSRTAPCKTFAGAISKTAAGGEIDALDPGGFGTVTITKSILIDGTAGQGFGSILASGTTGVVVNDSATATPNTIVVTLRNLSINGAGTTLGTNGINFVAGKTLNIENVNIQNFSTTGIRVALSVSGGNMNVKDCNIFRTTTGVSVSTTSGFFTAVIDNSRIENQTTGVSCTAGGFATIRNSIITFATTGISITGPGNSANSENSLLSHNGTAVSVGAGTTFRTGRSVYIANTTAIANSGTAISFINNEMSANTNNVTGNALTNTSQN